jgi:mRNA interferase MazF
MVVSQGEVFWVGCGRPTGSEPGHRRPAVVVQSGRFNRSAIGTVVVCPITCDLALASAPGNVRLAKGEANLSKASVVNVSQITALDRSRFVGKIGTLSRDRLAEVLTGIAVVLAPDMGV